MRVRGFGFGLWILPLGVALLATIARPQQAEAQVDVAGTWALAVTTDSGLTHPTVTFEQDGGDLTGHYSSEALGEASVTGTVDGSDVTWRLDGHIQGQAVPVVYSGTLGDDGTISGTIDIANGMLTGTFTASRSAR